ncbi:hypothetical protein Tco_1081301 [Tanacetum coccineum]|uniref:Uncharacterized protein n=1 Tax=Tanacetum coccineum TaxID=301880 RepID=A0ABQ5HYB8_9ASTR
MPELLRPFRRPWIAMLHNSPAGPKNTALVLRCGILPPDHYYILGLTLFNKAETSFLSEKGIDPFAYAATQLKKSFVTGMTMIVPNCTVHTILQDIRVETDISRHYSRIVYPRGHDQKNDRQGSDRQGGGGNYRNNNNNNYSRDNNRNSGAGRDQRNRGKTPHRILPDIDDHPLQFLKTNSFINALPLDMWKFDIILVWTGRIFPEELPGIPPIRNVELNIELIPKLEPISQSLIAWQPEQEGEVGIIAGIKVEEEIYSRPRALDIEFMISLDRMVFFLTASTEATEFRVDDYGIIWQGTKIMRYTEDPTTSGNQMTEAHSSSIFRFNPVRRRCTTISKQHFWWSVCSADVATENHTVRKTRQKSYADRHRRALEFQPGEHVFLKVSPTRGVRRFGIKCIA